MDTNIPSSPSGQALPSQEQLLLAFQQQQKRKEQNRKNQETFRNNQKAKIISLEAQVQSLESQVQSLRSQSQPIVSSSDYQNILQLQNEIQQLRSQLQSQQPYLNFISWFNQTNPQLFQQVNSQFTLFIQSQNQPTQLSSVPNVHLQ
jgi:vacuolar-type H+-ATPase subunit I/STV1